MPGYLTGYADAAAVKAALDKAGTATQPGDLGTAAALDVGTTAGTVAAGDDARLSDARTPTAHTHPSSAIADSTTAGRALLTAADADAQRTALGLGSAATTEASVYATAAQGTKADSAIQPADDADALGSGTATDGQVLTADGSGGAAWEDPPAGGGASAFTDLTDTPSDYSGQAGKLVKVNPTGDALIFGDPSGSSVAWGDITGTISAQTDLTPANIGAATAAQGALADTATQPGDLATVATTGAYSDLTGTPTLGTAAATDATAYATAAQGATADTALQPSDLASGTITPKTGDLDLSALADGTVTSVAVTGSDGIQVDSGSPITTAGTIALGIDAATLRTHINVEDGATADQTAQEIAAAIDADATAEGTLKTALGLGTAAYTAATAYEPADATILKDADIGVSVQAYDADIPTVSASQAEMEAGTETALRSMSPLRVAQAIAALGGSTGVFPFYRADGTPDSISLTGDQALPFHQADGSANNIPLVI